MSTNKVEEGQAGAPSTRAALTRGAQAAKALLSRPRSVKDAALSGIARALEEASPGIFAANREDLKAAKAAGLPEPILKRLLFDEVKLAEVQAGLKALVALPDPVGQVLEARRLDSGLVLRRISSPIGLIALIFESRPDALVQMAGLAAKSGNAIVVKGGKEAVRSNRILAQVVARAGIEAGLPPGWLTALETRDEIEDLLKEDRLVDLVIPRGSKEFVSHIMEVSSIPVMGHADGICHVYVDEAADPAMAARIVVDSKAQYPAACNAAEVLLIHSTFARRLYPGGKSGLEILTEALEAAGVELDFAPPTWAVEYLDLKMAVKLVDSLDEAIGHINTWGSGHTDAIVTASEAASAHFLSEVDSASVYHNASTRFADGWRYGLGAEVGISTGKLHARGPVGLQGLMTYKWVLEGSGQIVADYASGAKSFLHEDLPLSGEAQG